MKTGDKIKIDSFLKNGHIQLDADPIDMKGLALEELEQSEKYNSKFLDLKTRNIKSNKFKKSVNVTLLVGDLKEKGWAFNKELRVMNTFTLTLKLFPSQNPKIQRCDVCVTPKDGAKREGLYYFEGNDFEGHATARAWIQKLEKDGKLDYFVVGFNKEKIVDRNRPDFQVAKTEGLEFDSFKEIYNLRNKVKSGKGTVAENKKWNDFPRFKRTIGFHLNVSEDKETIILNHDSKTFKFSE